MGTIILMVLVIIVALVGPGFIKTKDPNKETKFSLGRQVVRIGGVFLALLLAAFTSFVFIGEDETGHRVKIYLGGVFF